MPATTRDLPADIGALGATGLLVAGGAGSRMGGGKAFVAFRGRPMIQWAIDLLRR